MEKMVSLRKFNNSDLELYQKWLYKEHVAKWYHEPLDWICEVQLRNTEYKWINHYIVEYDNQSIGFCQYYEYVNSGECWHGDTEMEGTYSIDYLIGEEDYLGKGLGKQIIKRLIDEIKNHSNAKRIIVQPEEENHASCGVLKSCDFTYNSKFQIYTLLINGIMEKEELLQSLDKLHTTKLGVDRIKGNLKPDTDDVVAFCMNKMKDVNCMIFRKGKNWYAETDDCRITINAHNYCIITAHKI